MFACYPSFDSLLLTIPSLTYFNRQLKRHDEDMVALLDPLADVGAARPE